MAFKVIDGLRTIEFGTPGESRENLNNLVILGKKRATSTTAQEYVDENEVIEHVGEELYILGNNGEAVGKVRITEVTQCLFAEVPDSFALAEAEGDLDAKDYRESHLEYWTRVGIEINDQTPVVLLYFDFVEQY
jgi:uncharacterized protein YhfF